MDNRIFSDDEAARQHLESLRWGAHRVCPHCGESERTSATDSKNHKPGLYYCLSCKKTFTVTVGTVFERSHIPLHKWVYAFHLMAASKKGISAHQLHRMLGVTYKSAWFMAHRIRKAMEERSHTPMGGGGGTIEADETYWGQIRGLPKKGGWHKHKIVSLIERGGKSRSFHVPTVTAHTIKTVLRNNLAKDAHLMTDEGKAYVKVGREFASHETVVHSNKEYVRGKVHTNTAESFFNILKRGLIGTYHHVSEQHLQRYLAEFDFRYSNRVKLGINDTERANNALKGISGKRLTYRRINAQ